MRSVKRR